MKITMKSLTLIFVTALVLNACKDKGKDKKSETITTERTENSMDDVVTSTLTSKDGKELKMNFNNTKGTATLDFQGETIEMDAEKAASGIWYKNDHYELRGKGNDIQLTRDGTIVFEHKDDLVNVEAKNKNGDVLNLTFNNTEGKVKAYLNGGEQIDLMEKKPASGIWYNNDHYELSGKGDSYTLKKDGKIIFQN